METCFKVLLLKFDQKLSSRTIGLTLNISTSTVFEVLARFKASSTLWSLPEALTPEALESLNFPEKKTSVLAPELPDWLHINTEMRRPGEAATSMAGIQGSSRKTDTGTRPVLPPLPGLEGNFRRSMRQEHQAWERIRRSDIETLISQSNGYSRSCLWPVKYGIS